MPRVRLSTTLINMNRVEYSLGGAYVQSIMRGPERTQVLRETIRQGLESMNLDMDQGHYDEEHKQRILVERFIRVALHMWLLSEVCRVPVTTEEFARPERPAEWDGVTYTTDGLPWTERRP